MRAPFLLRFYRPAPSISSFLFILKSFILKITTLDPFENEFPEVIEDCLEDGYACCCSPNRRGTLLAVGCLDGRVVIWDFDTRGIARVLKGHSHPSVASGTALSAGMCKCKCLLTLCMSRACRVVGA